MNGFGKRPAAATWQGSGKVYARSLFLGRSFVRPARGQDRDPPQDRTHDPPRPLATPRDPSRPLATRAHTAPPDDRAPAARLLVVILVVLFPQREDDVHLRGRHLLALAVVVRAVSVEPALAVAAVFVVRVVAEDLCAWPLVRMRPVPRQARQPKPWPPRAPLDHHQHAHPPQSRRHCHCLR